MRYGRIAATLVLVLLLGLLGSVAGPGWQPQPLTRTLVPETTDTTIGSDALTAPVGTYDVERETVDVEVADGVTIQATIAGPAGAPGARPGLLFMHGAGTATHENFADITAALASAGVVTMVPDKRSDTYTTRSRDYFGMAEDYLHSFAVLRSRPEVDPARVGVYGESEGAMAAPIAAATNPDVAFVVLVSAPVLPIRVQGAYAADAYLRDVGVPDRVLRAIPRLVGGQFPGGGFEYFDFDVSPYQERLTQPVLVAYGSADNSMPIVQGAQIILEDLEVAGNDHYTLRYYADANHGIRVNGDLAAGFPEDLARWILGLPETASAPPRIAGAEPEQVHRAGPVDRPRWFADGDMIVLSLLLGAGLLALGGVLALAGQAPRLWRRRPVVVPSPLARYTWAVALATLATWVVLLAYLSFVADLALNYRTNDLLVQAGWILVQGTGILAAAMMVLMVVAADRLLGAAGGSMAFLTRAVVGSVGAGAAVLLVSAAYWGVYPAVI